MRNNEIQDLTKRDADPRAYLQKQDPLNKTTQVGTWEEYFAKMFDEPLERPTHVKVLVRRHLPADSPINPYHVDLQIPFMFGLDDDYDRRWLGYIYDTTDENGWRFILMLPDPYIYLEYLAGKAELKQVYSSVSDDNFYICQPDMSNHLISISRSQIPDTATPAEHSMYDNNIWLDPSDLTSGMNVEDVYSIQELASKKKFYPEDNRYLQGGTVASIGGALGDVASSNNDSETQTPPALEGEIVNTPPNNETHTTI